MAYNNREKIQAELFELQDEKYRDFHSKLIPDMEKENIIGIRTPVLRKYAKQFAKTEDAAAFLQDIPHTYYEENNPHMMLITSIKEYDKCLKEIEKFLPYIDNWATCDVLRPKAFKKHPPALPDECRRWIKSGEIYAVRFGIEMLMTHYLDADFRPEYLEEVSIIKSKEYYVNMMIAWYFAAALAKQYEAAVPYIEQRRLAPWTHNKTIRKAIESYRVTEEHKAYLRTLTIHPKTL